MDGEIVQYITVAVVAGQTAAYGILFKQVINRLDRQNGTMKDLRSGQDDLKKEQLSHIKDFHSAKK